MNSEKWNRADTIELMQPAVKMYHKLAKAILIELSDANVNLDDEKEFEAFCNEIGVSPAVAKHWIAKKTDDSDQDYSRNDIRDIIKPAGKQVSIDKDIFTLNDASYLLSCTVSFLENEISEGRLPGYKIAGKKIILREELLTWIRSNRIVCGSEENSYNGALSNPRMVEVKRPRRVGKVNSEQKKACKEAIVSNVAAGQAITEAVRNAGISWSTFHSWKKADQDFNEAIEQAKML